MNKRPSQSANLTQSESLADLKTMKTPSEISLVFIPPGKSLTDGSKPIGSFLQGFSLILVFSAILK